MWRKRGRPGITVDTPWPKLIYLNGKVERVQKTDLQEYYAVEDINNSKLFDNLDYWRFHYNGIRPHSSLKGKTPMEMVCIFNDKTPIWDEVEAMYNDGNERIQEQNYATEIVLRKLLFKANKLA